MGFFVGLSKIDLKILGFVCEKGAHLPEREIARQLRLKQSTVAYSLKKMRRERAILRYNYRLNYPLLGFGATAWVFFKLRPGIANGQNPELAGADLFARLLSYPQVHVVSFVTGEHDISLKLIEKDVAAINSFVLRLATEMNDTIDSPEIMYCAKMFKTHNMLLEEPKKRPALGKADFEILNCKMLHPDAGVREIAEMLSLHRNTVSKRWKTLWREKILLKKTPVLNPEYYDALGIGLKAIIFFEVNAGSLNAAVEKLAAMPEVHELNHVLSGQDLMAIVRAKNVPALFGFLKKIYVMPGMKQTKSTIVLYSQPHKSNYLMELSRAGLLPFKLSEHEAGNNGNSNSPRKQSK